MAQQPIICVGDTTTHGGTVLEGFENFKVYGRQAAGQGHRVECPRCKGIFTIIEGATNRKVGGVPLALEGMLTSCGATLIASQTNARSEIDSTAASRLAFGPEAHAAHPAEAPPKNYDQQFHVLDEATGQPVANRRYRLTIDGMRFEGITDDQGRTQRVSARSGLDAYLEILPEDQ